MQSPDVYEPIIVDRLEIDLRHATIRDAMAANNIETLLIYSSALYPYGVHYAANYDLIGEGALVVVSRDEPPELYVSEEWELARAAAVSPLANIRHETDMAQLCGALLRRPRTAMAGLEWVGSSYSDVLLRASGGEARNASLLLELAARRKTPLERDLIRRAAALADIGFEAGLAGLRVGLKEYELAAEIEYAMRLGGAVDNFGLLSSGKHNRAIGLPTDKAVEPGDFLIFEITPAIYSRNYSAQLCRTMTMGPASDLAKDKYKILEEALAAGIAAVKPGARASQIVAAQDEVITRHGYGEYCRPPYMRARGHGFGLGRIDLAPSNQQELEEGTALIVHPNQYFPELGYLALGTMLLVTDTGAESLSRLRPAIYERD
jgi:Xaa-Pro aminopeptidase